jgi:hypothetical protein
MRFLMSAQINALSLCAQSIRACLRYEIKTRLWRSMMAQSIGSRRKRQIFNSKKPFSRRQRIHFNAAEIDAHSTLLLNVPLICNEVWSGSLRRA